MGKHVSYDPKLPPLNVVCQRHGVGAKQRWRASMHNSVIIWYLSAGGGRVLPEMLRAKFGRSKAEAIKNYYDSFAAWCLLSAQDVR